MGPAPDSTGETKKELILGEMLFFRSLAEEQRVLGFQVDVSSESKKPILHILFLGHVTQEREAWTHSNPGLSSRHLIKRLSLGLSDTHFPEAFPH